MVIRRDALRWLASHYGVDRGAIYASKFYPPEESMTREVAWWIEIPIDRIKSADTSDIHLVCQVSPDDKNFLYLKVPTQYFREHWHRLGIRNNGRVSLIISAEPKSIFVDQRGTGVAFGQFLQEGCGELGSAISK